MRKLLINFIISCLFLFVSCTPLCAIETGGPGTGSPGHWYAVSSFTRSDDDTFTVTDNSFNQAIFIVGRPIRYADTSGTWVYGIVTSYSTGTVDLDGQPMTTAYDTLMQYAEVSRVRQITFIMPGNAVVVDPFSFTYYWQLASANAVRSTWRAATAPTGANLTGNIEINGADLHASEISITAGSTAEFDSSTDIQSANFDIQFGETLTVTVSQVGSAIPGGNELIVSVIFIFP